MTYRDSDYHALVRTALAVKKVGEVPIYYDSKAEKFVAMVGTDYYRRRLIVRTTVRAVEKEIGRGAAAVQALATVHHIGFGVSVVQVSGANGQRWLDAEGRLHSDRTYLLPHSPELAEKLNQLSEEMQSALDEFGLRWRQAISEAGGFLTPNAAGFRSLVEAAGEREEAPDA